MDDFARIEAFVKVADGLSFNKAAEAMGVTTSAISKHIQALEHNLGVRLFYRTTRTTRLTQEGETFLSYCQRMVDDWQEAKQRMQDARAGLHGKLKVSVPLSFGVGYLTQTLAAFAAKNPDIELTLDFDDRYVDIIEEAYDVAIRIAALADSSLIARKLASCAHWLCASPAYLAAHGTPPTPDKLATHRFILYARSQTGQRWDYAAPDGSTGSITMKGHIRCNNADMMRAAALAGMGVGLFPDFMVKQEVAAGKLTPLFPHYKTLPERNIYAVFPHQRYLSTRVRAFVDHMTHTFAKQDFATFS